MLWLFYDFWKIKRIMRAFFFLEVFQSNARLSLGEKELYTNTQLHIIPGVWELRNLFCGLMEWRSGVLKWSGVKFCVVW